MNQYQFERIVRTMESRYGKMKKGREEDYSMMLLPMEGNALKVWRKHPDSNCRRMEEAILLALYVVKNQTDEEVVDVESFQNPENRRLKDALLYAFDPASNEEIKTAMEETGIIVEDWMDFYRVPVLCLMRIRDSVLVWRKKMGTDGYFKFLESQMEAHIPSDDKMNYSIIQKM